MTYLENYNRWLESSYISEETKAELRTLSEDEIKSRFSAELEFGTAGIRRVMEAGPGSLNEYTVRHITRAIADNLLKGASDTQRFSAVIAYDSRNNSKEYGTIAAQVLAARGIHVFLYESLRPTPELSFAVRYSGSAVGINITASHNTKEYNGYKVYGPDGAQISPEHASEIANIIANTDILEPADMMDYQEAVFTGAIEEINGYFDSIYKGQVLAQSKLPDDVPRDLKIVYTAFHGTGFMFIPEILQRDGFENVVLVEEQCVPNGDFPTVKSPNPETVESFAMAIELARKENADLIIGTDPDGDRCGVAIPVSGGAGQSDNQDYRVLTGNQIGVMLLDYLIKVRGEESSEKGNNPYACKSIVSTSMANRICEKHGIEMVETLTGFKYIGEKMEELSDREFILGFEESNGYLTGLYARDKDAVVASMLVAETTAYHKAHGRTMEEALNALYEEYGYYLEKGISKGFSGVEGSAEMKKFMEDMRNNPPTEIAGERVIRIRDYLTGEIHNLNQTMDNESSGDTDISASPTEKTGLPTSNVLFYELADRSSVIIRPSGTEPKVKFYLSAVADNRAAAEAKLEELIKAF